MTTLRTDTDHWPHQLQNSVPRDNNKHRDLLVMVTFMNPYLDKVALWAVVSIGCRNGELADGRLHLGNTPLEIQLVTILGEGQALIPQTLNKMLTSSRTRKIQIETTTIHSCGANSNFINCTGWVSSYSKRPPKKKPLNQNHKIHPAFEGFDSVIILKYWSSFWVK